MKTIDPSSKNKPVSIAVLCCVLSFLAYSSNYTGRSTLSTLAAELNSAGILSTHLFGIACSLFSVFYAFGRFISGYCGDFVPAKILIFTGVIGTGICNIAIGIVMNKYAITVLWTLNAVFQSIVYGSLLVVAAAVCTEKNKTLYMMFIEMTLGFGQIIGYIIIPILVKTGGIRAGFIVPGLISASVALLIVIFFPVVPSKGSPARIGKSDLLCNIKFFLKNREYRAVLFPCIANGIIRDGITVWLASFIMRTYRIDLSSLAYFAIAVPVINTLAKFVFPFFYRILDENELKLGLLCSICTTVTILPLCFGLKNPVTAVVCLSLSAVITSMANMAYVGMWPLRFESSNKVSFAAGMIDMPIYLGSGITSVFFGFMIEGFGFRSMYIVLAVCAAISTVPLAYSQRGTVKKI